jgi:hypothetical protein
MTAPGTPAYFELEWSVSWRDSLIFRNEVHVGQLVFAFDDSVFQWMPYWVVDAENGKYEIVDAYGDKRIKDITADKLGIAVKNGKTFNEIH